MAHKTSSFTAKILSGNKDEPASAPVTKAVSKISLPPPPTKKKRRQRVKNVRRHRKGKCTGFKPDLSGFDFEDKNPIVLQDSPAHDGSRSHTQCSCKGSEQIISREKSRTHRRTETRTHRQADFKKKDPPPFLGATSVFFGKGGAGRCYKEVKPLPSTPVHFTAFLFGQSPVRSSRNRTKTMSHCTQVRRQ